MFTGCVETHELVLKTQSQKGGLRLFLKRPSSFQELNRGESFSINGVCLTLEAFTSSTMQFFLSQRTLKKTGWNLKKLENRRVNLERSLRFGDSLHGHIVTGHIDTVGKIQKKEFDGETLILFVDYPQNIQHDLFENASVTLNGVSLTVSKLYKNHFTVHLIPETLKKTNLKHLKKGETVNLESDFMIKGLWNIFKKNQEIMKRRAEKNMQKKSKFEKKKKT